MQSCQFINCGSSNSDVIIKMDNVDSSLNLNDCIFKFNNPTSCMVIDTLCTNLIINNCQFIKTGSISRSSPKSESLPDKTLIFNITQCIFDSCQYVESKSACYNLDFTRPATVIFENNLICNIESSERIMIIDANDKIEQVEFRNVSLINNTCYSHLGGGSGIVFRQVPYVIFTDCIFINNTAKQKNIPLVVDFAWYNGDGGGIQIGFYCDSNEAAVKFDRCIFRENKADKHGGAISIQTLSTVEIFNCTFESNEANLKHASSSRLLFDSHYDKKTYGRGGAIYINPNYNYEFPPGNPCYDLNASMTSVSIRDCLFLSNSAYDGYSIYIEGEDGGT